MLLRLNAKALFSTGEVVFLFDICNTVFLVVTAIRREKSLFPVTFTGEKKNQGR